MSHGSAYVFPFAIMENIVDREMKITVGELASLLSLSRQAIYKRLRRGDLPSGLSKRHPGPGRTVKGRRIVFTPDQADAWIIAYAGGMAKWKRNDRAL